MSLYFQVSTSTQNVQNVIFILKLKKKSDPNSLDYCEIIICPLFFEQKTQSIIVKL